MSPESRLLIHMDDQPLSVEKGVTILQAARQNGIEIPTLCDFPGLPPHGSCRLCIVEIKGRHNTPTACTTPAEEGMVIYTHSPKVRELRRELIQMLLAEHPSACVFCPEKERCDECMVTLRKAGVTTGCGSCPKNEQCELQTLAAQYGVEKPVYPIRYHLLPVEKRDPFIDRDDNLCILCGRCIRACESLHFASSMTFTRRGVNAQVDTAFQRTHLETGCTFCGSCVEVCPTGALTEKTRKWSGKPERETPTTCPFCAIGCQIQLLSKQGRVIGSLPNHRAGTGVLCVKGRFSITEMVNHPMRLKQPQKRAGVYLQGIGWEEALSSAAEKLAACAPGRFGLRISASCTNEDLYVARQFARQVMKTGLISTSAHTGYGSGMGGVARLLQASCSLEIIDNAPVVLCLGLEDPYASVVVEEHLLRAKNRGGKIIHLGTRRLGWSGNAEVWLPAGRGEEMSLIQNLAELTTRQDSHQPEASSMDRAARLLSQSDSPVIILGPALLAHPGNPLLVQSVERLVQSIAARVITLPEPANLAGALRLGLGSAELTGRDLDVLYLIGEAVPAALPGRPFILYQNICPPEGAAEADLLLPAAAFSEQQGTFIDYAGRVRELCPAVPAPGEALPGWMILSRIARQMGAQGFDYTCVEDIWRAAQAELPGFPDLPQRTGEALVAGDSRAGMGASDEPSYLGFPLAHWAAGLRSLYPETFPGGRV
jgi:NADH dehydrogenase/NADH:ubiquinone oxidoreductase subunit G